MCDYCDESKPTPLITNVQYMCKSCKADYADYLKDEADRDRKYGE